MHIKVDDTVEIITGADSASELRGKVLKVFPEKGKLLVEGAAKVYKHVKPSQRNPKGGKLSKEMPIDISNVMLVCTECKSRTKTGAKIKEDGSKVRYCKSCNAEIGQLSPAK
ncbi:50S ribosomal protein L24 [Bremerella alba]|uniref:Large ribosomal subunit protein uL24 n=1 Tax=Bremerella alba TaxID=980252 RepID=A0A7V8V3V9_9BACT|nr:50S ribosomal protein L24 [Bremerella alba]MBA2114448.1 50S ribosomal protein L24 [Bremerella alba]